MKSSAESLVAANLRDARGVRGRPTLSAPAAGSGVFRPGIAARQTLTLVLRGNGNSCTSGIDFSHWTLVMQGPKANYTLFGIWCGKAGIVIG